MEILNILQIVGATLLKIWTLTTIVTIIVGVIKSE